MSSRSNVGACISFNFTCLRILTDCRANSVPSQLVAPTLLVHALVHTNAAGDQLWFHRGVPGHWFLSGEDGGSLFRISAVPMRIEGTALIEASTNVTAHANGTVTCALTVFRVGVDAAHSGSGAGTLCSVRLLPADGQTSYAVQVNGKVWSDLDRAHGIIRNVPCVPTQVTTLHTFIELVVSRIPAPPPHNFPTQPTVPPRCNCTTTDDCAFIAQPSQRHNVFAYLDDGGPEDDRDNWESALNWSVATHVIRNTHHPLLINVDGDLVLNDADWPCSKMLCTAHSKGVRVLADVDPLGFDVHHTDPAMEEATFLRNTTAITRAALRIAEFISAAGYDGAAFDFEGLSVGSWSLKIEHEVGDGLIRFMKETRAAIRAKNPRAEVAFAVAANNNPW